MECKKCRHTLPDDSEFCQYCGSRIEKAAVTAAEDFITEAEKPGTAVVSEEPVEKIVAVQPLAESPKAPAEFVSNNAAVTKTRKKPKKEKKVKKKYCSRCGSIIDAKTKECTGCGKKYFKGIRLSKFSVTVIILSVFIAGSLGLNVYQFMSDTGLQSEIDDLKQQLSNKQSTIVRLVGQVDDLEKQVSNKQSTITRLVDQIGDLEYEKFENKSKLTFFDNYAEIVGDDGTNLYHKFGCSKLDTSDGFWIHNTGAAADRYTQCSLCH